MSLSHLANADTIINVLRCSISGSAESRNWAAKSAIELESKDPFLIPCCLYIYDSCDDQQVRFLAICFVKNIVGRAWKTLSEDARSLSKNILLRILCHQSVLYLRELMVVIRRIVRYDFPHQWPELSVWLHSNTSLPHFPFVLKHVIKEVDSRKIGRKETREVLQSLFRVVICAWTNPSYKPIEELDSAILILAKMMSIHDLAQGTTISVIHTYCINRWRWLMSAKEEQNFRKFLKFYSELFSCHREAFINVSAIIGNLAVASLDGPIGVRSYAVRILQDGLENSEFLSQESLASIVEKLFRSGICLDKEDVEEWLANPFDSLAGPLDGSDLRENCFEFIRTLIKRFGDEFFENFHPSSDLQLLDAWLDCQINLYSDLRNFAQESLSLSAIAFSLISNDPFQILVSFRLIKLLEMFIRNDLQQSQLVEVFQLLSGRIVDGNSGIIRVVSVLAIKALFDRFPDNPIWTSQSLLISELVTLISICGDSEIVQWRIINFVNLLCKQSDLPDNTVNRLGEIFFKSKSEMIRISILDFLCLCPKNVRDTKLCLRIIDEGVGGSTKLRNVPGHRAVVSVCAPTDEIFQESVRLLMRLVETADESDKVLLHPYIGVVLRCWDRQLSARNPHSVVVECILAFDVCELFNGDDLRISDQLQLCTQTLSLIDSLPDTTVDACLDLVGVVSVVFVGQLPVDIFSSIVHRLSSEEQEDGESMVRIVAMFAIRFRQDALVLLDRVCGSCQVLMQNLTNCFDCMFGPTERMVVVSFMGDVVLLGRKRGNIMDMSTLTRATDVIRKQMLALESKKPRMEEITANNRIKQIMSYAHEDPRELWSELESKIIQLSHS